MENSFLKDAINRIVELATPFTLETRNGHQFCSADLREVKPEVELPARYSVDTLEALVKLIRTEGVAQAPQLYVRVDSARRVVVDSTYTGRDYAIYSRLPLYEAVSDVPSISVNQYMSQEHAVIELQSLYAVTDDRDYLLALLSRIDVNQGVSSVDNGISQEVSVRTGASLVESLNSGKQVSVTSGWISGGNSATDGALPSTTVTASSNAPASRCTLISSSTTSTTTPPWCWSAPLRMPTSASSPARPTALLCSRSTTAPSTPSPRT